MAKNSWTAIKTAESSSPKLSLGTLLEATFLQRDNRFRAEVLLDGQPVKVHVANSGRMRELLTAGKPVWVRSAAGAGRKTAYDLVLVAHEGHKVCLNAHMANTIFAFWLENGLLPELKTVSAYRREQVWGEDSRFDFALQMEDEVALLEVKSVNLVEKGTARFPDAPTARGARHVRELTAYQKAGGRSFIVFVVMRDDAEDFAPNAATDPDFAQSLAEARAAGVTVLVYRAVVNVQGITFGGRIAY